jgi:hypothetical protein
MSAERRFVTLFLKILGKSLDLGFLVENLRFPGGE